MNIKAPARNLRFEKQKVQMSPRLNNSIRYFKHSKNTERSLRNITDLTLKNLRFSQDLENPQGV